MKRSTNRILTTHTGRLDGPKELRELTRAAQGGKPIDIEANRALVQAAMAEVVRRQAEVGIDVISDGEVGHFGFGNFAYYQRRIKGIALKKLKEGEPASMSQATNERLEFAEFYQDMFPGGRARATERAVCDGPLSYIGEAETKADIQRFKDAVAKANVKVEECFMTALSPGWMEHFFYNEHYKTDEEYLFALAEAVRPEYKTIVDSGLILQLDDPALPDTYDMIVPNPSIEDYRKFAAIRVEAINHALEGIPEDRVRYHICWGSWHGPHTHDLPLKHVVDLMLKVKAGGYSVEAANPRHEHEWKIWKDVKLPAGKVLIPGVVSHASNVVEHPELVSDRILQFAQLVGRENVIASTDCGMGGRTHPQIGWAKLKSLAEGAAMASKELFGR